MQKMLTRRVHQGRSVDLSQGMIVFQKDESTGKRSSTKIETWIKANLVLVWFRDKPEKKKATTKAKKGGKKGG